MFIRKARMLFTLDSRTLRLYMEAYLYLGYARLQMRRPFAKVAPALGIKTEETPDSCDTSQLRTLRQISSAIHVASKYTLWDSKCLVRAIAGMKMLERRQLASTLYLGTAKDEGGKLIAHAWLRSGPLYISGADVMNQFTVIEKFANRAG
jgi:hypothetical protein